MSIEFWASLVTDLSEDLVLGLKRYIQDHLPYQIVRDGLFEFGMVPIQNGRTAHTSETITLSIQANQVYVAFHAAGRTDRETFIRCVVDALVQVGVVSMFEEL